MGEVLARVAGVEEVVGSECASKSESLREARRLVGGEEEEGVGEGEMSGVSGSNVGGISAMMGELSESSSGCAREAKEDRWQVRRRRKQRTSEMRRMLESRSREGQAAQWYAVPTDDTVTPPQEMQWEGAERKEGL